MAVIQIHDCVPPSGAVVDPRIAIPVLGEHAFHAEWQVAGVARYNGEFMIVGDEAAERLESLAGLSDRISGALLRDLLDRVAQVIWGEFKAYVAGSEMPWVTVRAIDSSWCEVETDDAGVLDRVRQTFAKCGWADKLSRPILDDRC